MDIYFYGLQQKLDQVIKAMKYLDFNILQQMKRNLQDHSFKIISNDELIDYLSAQYQVSNEIMISLELIFSNILQNLIFMKNIYMI